VDEGVTAHATSSRIPSIVWSLESKQISGHTVARGTRYVAVAPRYASYMALGRRNRGDLLALALSRSSSRRTDERNGDISITPVVASRHQPRDCFASAGALVAQ
jgi:hypothetical protein